MNGILVINHYLNSPKFNELYDWIKKSAYIHNINLSVKTNREISIDINNFNNTHSNIYPPIDFVLFWDKDILLAKYLESMGIRVYNSSFAIKLCDDKALTHMHLMKSGIRMPRTIMPPFTYFAEYQDLDFTKDIESKLGFPMVIKARKGSFGKQVHLATTHEELVHIINSYPANSLLFQEYISSSKGRDIRIHIVGGKYITAMYRYSTNNDFRANVTNGAHMKPYTPTKEQIQMAIISCKELGLDFAGVDILIGKNDEPILCEVNSNAHFINIYKCTGVNIADSIFEYIIKDLSSCS